MTDAQRNERDGPRGARPEICAGRLRLFRRFTGDPRPYRVGMALLVFEAVTAVVEPIPIAYLIDFLQGARPSLRELGVPALLTSERIETILLLTLAIVADRGDQQRRRLVDRGVHGARRPLPRLQHPGRDVLAPAAPVAGLPRHASGPATCSPGSRATCSCVEEFVVKSVEQHRRQPAGAASAASSSCSTSRGAWPWSRSSWSRCWRWSRTTTPAGSRSPRRPSATARASWPPPPRRCSPRSGSCRATAAARSTWSASPTQTGEEHAGLAARRQHPGAVQLRDRARRGAGDLGGGVARRVAGRPGRDHGRHAGAVRPAAAEHVQARPQDRQRVVQDRQGLRQRRADRGPARPRDRASATCPDAVARPAAARAG